MAASKNQDQRTTTPGIKSAEVKSAEVETEVQWMFRTKDFPAMVKRKLVAGCIMVGVRAVYNNHAYTFGGEIFIQEDRGPIGNRLTMCLSTIRMMMWAKRLLQTLSKMGIRILLAVCYVDDLRFLTKLIELGWEVDKGSLELVFNEELKERETREGKTRTQKTAEIFKVVMNMMSEDLTFTVETCEDFENMKLPTLDLDLWVEATPHCPQLYYSFYEKKISNPRVIMATGAMDWSSQRAILAQETIRRMENTSLNLDRSVRNNILNEYCRKLARSSYTRSQIRLILESGLKGWKNKLARAKAENRPYHRPGASTVSMRMRKKLTEKSTWFRKMKKDKEDLLFKPKGDPRREEQGPLTLSRTTSNLRQSSL